MRNVFGWSYPAGAEHDPNAPYNQPDYTDQIIEKQWEVYVDRLTDEPDAWIAEGITQGAGERANHLYQLVIKNLKIEDADKDHDTILGRHIRELVQLYATPSEDDALEMLTEETERG